MRVDEVIQTTIIYLQQKGINTDEQLLRRLEILDKFNTIRAKFLSDMLIAGNKISAINYQTIFEDANGFSDENERLIAFNCPQTVMGKIEFVGSTNGVVRFRQSDTLMEYQSTIKSQIPSITRYYRDLNQLLLDNRNVSTIRINALCVNPYSVSTFNPDYDQYPIDEALMPQLNEALFKVYFSKISQVKPDVKPDSTQS
jgi:hypothetical protein